MPEKNETPVPGREIEQRGRGHKSLRCSICTKLTWFRSIALHEPLEAPEPRRGWVLCKPCYEALLLEMQRSSVRSPIRLRIAVGLVAAERSPLAARMGKPEQQDFQRDFSVLAWALILFALLHLVILVIVFVGIR